MKLKIYLFLLIVNIMVANVNDDLVSAIQKNELIKVRSLKTKLKDINQVISTEIVDDVSRNLTSLMVAAIENNYDVAKIFIDSGADIDFRVDGYGLSALDLAVKNNNSEVTQLLLENGAEFGDALLDCTYDTAKLLINYGANVNERYGVWFDTPLYKAVEKNDVNLIKLFLSYGANPSEYSPKSEYITSKNFPIDKAIELGNLEVVKLLVENGLKYDSPKYEGRNPIITASMYNRLDILNYFFETNSFSKDIIDKCLFENNTYEVMKFLIEKGAKPDVLSENEECLKLLLENGANVNWSFYDSGRTEFLAALYSQKFDYAKLLIKYGADPYLSVKTDEEKLIVGSFINDITTVRKLLSSGIDVDVILDSENPEGDTLTPLMYASINNSYDVSKLLILKKANIDKSSHDREFVYDIDDKPTGYERDKLKTPLIYAIENGSLEIVKLLISSGAKLDGFKSKKSIFMLSVEHGNAELIDLFYKKNININLKDIYGNTAMIYAIKNKNLNGVKYLLEKGYKLTYELDTILEIEKAIEANESEIFEILFNYATKNKKMEIWLLNNLLSCSILENNYFAINKIIDYNPKVLDTLYQLSPHNILPPLSLAALFGKVEAVDLLILKGSNIFQKSKSGHTIFDFVAMEGNIEIYKKLINYIGEEEYKKIDKEQLMYFAKYYKRHNFVKYLRETL